MGKFQVVQWVIGYYSSNSWPIGGNNEGGEEVKRK